MTTDLIITEPAEVEDALRALIAAGVERGLTLYPEWAEAVRKLGKTCENRPVRPPSTLPIGSRFAIHAGAARSKPASGHLLEVVAYSARLEGWRYGLDGFSKDGVAVAFEPVCSAIVATVRLVGVIEPRGSIKCGPWHIPRSWGWLLGDVQPLPRPIKCPGSQGLWRLARVADEMRANL